MRHFANWDIFFRKSRQNFITVILRESKSPNTIKKYKTYGTRRYSFFRKIYLLFCPILQFTRFRRLKWLTSTSPLKTSVKRETWDTCECSIILCCRCLNRIFDLGSPPLVDPPFKICVSQIERRRTSYSIDWLSCKKVLIVYANCSDSAGLLTNRTANNSVT